MKEMIQFSPSDFFRKDNAALVLLLVTALRVSGEELNTRDLCELAFKSRSHGLAVIKRAEKEGYLWRSKGSAKKGVMWRGGGKERVCKITEKGLMLLRQLGILRKKK